MHYINSVPYAFDKTHAYINMCRAVIVDDLFQNFSEVANDDTTWPVPCAPEFLIIDLNHNADAGHHGFTLETYKNELCNARQLSFSNFVQIFDTPFRE